jgi:pyruvate/2-oxoglutarate dehydrogenase complex dihydrolipoamide acyltransferase (E2) component
MSAAVSVCTHLGRDWQATFEPTIADIVIRAFARAIGREPSLRELDPSIAVLDLGAEQGMGCSLKDAAKRSFKNAVSTLAEQSPEMLNDVHVSFTDYGMLGIVRATPRLLPGQSLALAFGARTFGPAPAGDAVAWKPMANVCLAYDGNLVNDGAAARVLSRLRSLVEMPDELLTD